MDFISFLSSSGDDTEGGESSATLVEHAEGNTIRNKPGCDQRVENISRENILRNLYNQTNLSDAYSCINLIHFTFSHAVQGQTFLC